MLYDIDFAQTEDDGYRAYLEQLYKDEGADALYDLLLKKDPASANSIHKNNVKRVIRALEYEHQTGQQISTHNATEREKTSPYNFAYFVLNCDRAKLYERIDQRVDIMMEQGLVDEVKSLVSEYGLSRDMVSMQGLGYKEILQYLDGEISLDEAVYILKRDTRHFAKRQLTWFRRERDVICVDKDQLVSEEEQLDFMLAALQDRKIIS